jgi:hypothetical protein
MRYLVAIALMLAQANPALAQLRTIPQDARLGQIRHLSEMLIEIDGKERRLSPGAQIRDDSNRIIVPTAIPAGAAARYVVDGEGNVRQVWLLTSEEAAQSRNR